MSTHRRNENKHKILVRKFERKRSLETPRRRREKNSDTALIEVTCKRVDWIHLAQEMEEKQAVMNTVTNS
jgi:hypothetical protein